MSSRPILLGVIGRPHGVRGFVRVTSHTADPSALAEYGPLSDAAGRGFTLRWMGEGIAEVFEVIDGKPVRITDRTAAERLTNTRLFIERDRLPAPEPDEYYLADLTGLTVVDAAAAAVGVVSAVHDYGAGAILEIAHDDGGAWLVPFTTACVPEVDIAAGRITIVPPDAIDVPDTVFQSRHPPACPGDRMATDPAAGHGDADATPMHNDGVLAIDGKAETAA